MTADPPPLGLDALGAADGADMDTEGMGDPELLDEDDES